MTEKIAHIVYASDDKFAEILGVSLVSLYENSRDMNDIVVYIFELGISDEKKEKINSIAEKYDRHNIVFIPFRNINKELGIEVSTDRGSVSQYARLFISSQLSNDLERVLYLDCDVLLQKSIRELWNLEMHGKTIAALRDAFSRQYRKNIGLKENDIMFNSGVMLINLKKWREQNVDERLLEFIRSKRGKVQQSDQGVLNSVLSYDTYCFEPRFNSVTIFYDFTYEEMLIYRKPPEFYTKSEVMKAIEDPNVIHFTTSFLSRRPWMKNCRHKYVGEWMKYKEMSPWKDVDLWEDNGPLWKQIVLFFWGKCPRNIALRIAGIFQAYVRPLTKRLLT